MEYHIFLHPKANKFLDKSDEKLQERIKAKLQSLKSKPRKGKRLSPTNFWRLRIGDYRAIYEIKQKEKKVIVLFLGHRKKVYDDFKKLI